MLGAVGALLKKARVSKTLVIIASAIIIGSIVTAGVTGLSTVRNYNSNEQTMDRQIISTGAITGDTVIINLHSDGTTVKTNNYLPDFF